MRRGSRGWGRVIEFTFISVVSWPEGLSVGGRTDLIAGATGQDLVDARRGAQRDAPVVIARVEAPRGAAVVRALEAGGASAFSSTERVLRSIAPPVELRSMVPAGPGRYQAELRNAASLELVPERDLLLLVRATVKTSRTTVSSSGGVNLGRAALVAPEVAIAYGVHQASTGGGAARSLSPRATSELIDLWVRDPRTSLLRRFRVMAHRFDAHGLFPGERRAITGREEADRLSVRLAELAPAAMVDTGFKSFRAPGTIVTHRPTRKGLGSVTDEMPAFDFYSPWRWLLHERASAG